MKKIISVLLASAMALSLAACGEDAYVNVETQAAGTESAVASDSTGTDTTTGTAEYSIKIATTGNSKQPPSLATQDFMNAVKENTNGRYEFELHDSSTLGGDSDILQQVMDGTLQVSAVGGTTFSMYTELLEVLSLPFLITNYDLEYKALQSDEYKAICDRVGEELGIKILFTSENGIRHFATVNKPIYTVEDLKGLKIRIPTSTVLDKTIKALGANPQTIAYSELYSSLQNSVIDGEEVNYSTLAGQHHYEVAMYVTEAGMYCFSGMVIANLDWWNSLNAEDQKIIEDACRLAEENTFTKYVVDLDESSRQECIDNGMTVIELTDEQLQGFKDATASIIDEYAAKDPLIADYVEMARNLS